MTDQHDETPPHEASLANPQSGGKPSALQTYIH